MRALEIRVSIVIGVVRSTWCDECNRYNGGWASLNTVVLKDGYNPDPFPGCPYTCCTDDWVYCFDDEPVVHEDSAKLEK